MKIRGLLKGASWVLTGIGIVVSVITNVVDARTLDFKIADAVSKAMTKK